MRLWCPDGPQRQPHVHTLLRLLLPTFLQTHGALTDQRLRVSATEDLLITILKMRPQLGLHRLALPAPCYLGDGKWKVSSRCAWRTGSEVRHNLGLCKCIILRHSRRGGEPSRDESAQSFGVTRRSYVCGARSSNGADSRVCSRTVRSSGGAY